MEVSYSKLEFMTGKNASPTTRITVDEDGITTFTGKQLIDLPASNITPN